MPRPCRINECPRNATHNKTLCDTHRYRIRRYGDPHHTQWGVADNTNIQTIIREQRPTQGLTRLERVLVAHGLTAHGLPATEIARILGVHPRTVYRWRSSNSRTAA